MMKKLIALLFIALLLGGALWYACGSGQVMVNWNGEQVHGPLGALLAGGGLLGAALIVFLCLLFAGLLMAGLGLMLAGGLILLPLVAAAFAAPLLLPLLILLVIVWAIAMRARGKRRGGVKPD